MEFEDDEGPPIPLEHSEWEIVCVERVMFGEVVPEKPWIRHQICTEDHIGLHLCQPVEKPDTDGMKVPHCVCNKVVPGEVMLRFYWVKSIYEGKRCGAKAIPNGVKVKL